MSSVRKKKRGGGGGERTNQGEENARNDPGNRRTSNSSKSEGSDGEEEGTKDGRVEASFGRGATTALLDGATVEVGLDGLVPGETDEGCDREREGGGYG